MNPTPSARTERPPRAVVGAQVSYDEEMFGEAFDGVVVRPILALRAALPEDVVDWDRGGFNLYRQPDTDPADGALRNRRRGGRRG